MHPEIDRFIKAILRIYGGELFNTFLEISEQKIAAQAEVNTAEVRKKLHYLQSINLFLYEPAHTSPQIVFTTMRYDAAKLPLNIREMNVRKEKEAEKLRCLIQYVSQEKRCRSLVLQDYFGEQSEQECGVCDHCLNKKRQSATAEKTVEIRTFILSMIGKGIRQIDILTAKNTIASKEEMVRVVQAMVDEELLKIDASGLIFISGQ
jgi:ATP-dependent DNA helicase RecQ